MPQKKTKKGCLHCRQATLIIGYFSTLFRSYHHLNHIRQIDPQLLQLLNLRNAVPIPAAAFVDRVQQQFVLGFAVLAQVLHLFFSGQTSRVNFDQLEQLLKLVEVDPAGLSTEEKMKHLREYREAQYELLLDAVYKRRGWDRNSVPKVEKLKELGVDLPEVLEVIKQARE